MGFYLNSALPAALAIALFGNVILSALLTMARSRLRGEIESAEERDDLAENADEEINGLRYELEVEAESNARLRVAIDDIRDVLTALDDDDDTDA